jgi:integrase
MRPQRVGQMFEDACKAAGLGTDWHEQRHTFVSVLSDAGLNMDAIADAAGHVNATRTVYRHQIADKVARAAQAMDQTSGAHDDA